jgi:hypothetical protein
MILIMAMLLICSTSIVSNAKEDTTDSDEVIYPEGDANVLQVGDVIYMSMFTGSIEGIIDPTGVIAYNTKTKDVKTILATGYVDCYYKGYIYCCGRINSKDKQSSYYRINVKTGKYKKLSALKDGYISEIYKDRLYYIISKKDESNTLYSCKLDGTDKKKIVSGIYLSLIHKNIYKNRIYYSTKKNDKYSFYSCNLSGKGKKKLISAQNNLYVMSIDDSGIYYKINSDEDVESYVMDLDGSNKKFLAKGYYEAEINNKIIYQVSKDGTDYVYVSNKDGTKAKN